MMYKYDDRPCETCACGCKGICHTLLTCNGTHTCVICHDTFPTCRMQSLKYAICDLCDMNESKCDRIIWTPTDDDPHQLWAITKTFFDEIMFLNYEKTKKSPALRHRLNLVSLSIPRHI